MATSSQPTTTPASVGSPIPDPSTWAAWRAKQDAPADPAACRALEVCATAAGITLDEIAKERGVDLADELSVEDVETMSIVLGSMLEWRQRV